MVATALKAKNTADLDQQQQTYCIGSTYCIKVPVLLAGAEVDVLASAFHQLYQGPIHYTQIALDFSQTTFMDCMGLSALVAAYKRAAKAGTYLVLKQVPPQVMLVLSMTGMDRWFAIEEAII